MPENRKPRANNARSSNSKNLTRKSTTATKTARKPQKKKQKSPFAQTVGPLISKTLLTLLIVLIITGSIVVVALAIMVLRLVDTNDTVEIDKDSLTHTSILYATNYETDEKYEIKRVYSGENSIWLDFDKIPDTVKKAAVAVEDKRFYEHAGVDWKRTAAVSLKFLVQSGGSLQGGSTIDQQVVKNITGKNEYRVERKVQEIFSALNLDKKYTKDEILEAYLNIIPLGNNTRGIEAASQFYFGKSASELNLAESASLVGITKNPTKFDPTRDYDENLKRRQHILKLMAEQNLITEAEKEEAYTVDLNLNINEAGEKPDKISSYFEDAVIEEMISIFMDEPFKMTRQKASSEVFTGGYKINTTMDKRLQDVMEGMYKNEYDRLYRTVRSTKPVQGASVLTDEHGRVLALVGGVGEKTRNRDYNRATMSKRSPGSTMKPLSPYALAIEDNLITYSSIYEDKKLEINSGGEVWSPRNYYPGYKGRMTVDTAVKLSVNTVAVQVELEVGPKNSFDFLRSVGVNTLIENEKSSSGTLVSDISVSPMSLGSLTDGVKVIEWTGAYQIFMNGGKFTKPYMIESIYDSDDNLVFMADMTETQVISDATAHVVNQMMQDVVYSPGGTGAFAAGVPNTKVAAKTGTTNDNKDLWFMGGTADYVLSVWIGHDKQKPVPYGAPYAPVVTWTELMKEIVKVAPSTGKFPESSNVEKIQFCSITGEKAEENCPIGGTGVYKKSHLPPPCSGHNIFDYTYDEDGNMVDRNGNFLDESGNIIDDEGNIKLYRQEDGSYSENPDGTNNEDDDDEDRYFTDEERDEYERSHSGGQSSSSDDFIPIN